MRSFDADKFFEEGKSITLGGRVFEVPIIPAITSLVISQNAAAYGRFGTPDEDEESRAVAMKVLATILNQRVPENDRVSPEWIEQRLDMRSMTAMIVFLFAEPEKKNADAEEEPQEPQKQEGKAVE
jgi:hypothetical protein